VRVVVVGSGGREHALATVLGRSADVVVTPGNPGIPGSVATPATDLEADLFVIGPEAPMVAGLADELRAAGRLVLGPGADGARLEGSKAWMKDLLVSAGVPTARHATFGPDRLDDALAFLDTLGGLHVIKTDGLAAGKGVVVTESRDEARAAVADYLSGSAFGTAGTTCVIEEGLTGPEVSVFALSDGQRAVLIGTAQDHKRVGDGDTGPNTGGMGAYTPVPVAGDDVVGEIMDRAVEPTLAALRSRGVDYRGFLFCNAMLTPDGPKVLEYNVRFGDPEAQTILPLLTSDLVTHAAEAAAGGLRSEPAFATDAAVTVVLASEGYPVRPRTGDVIGGLDEAAALDGVRVFSAGVDRDGDGRLVTAGGRVLNVVGRGPDLVAARDRAYAGVDRLSWPGLVLRRDIGASALPTGNGR
jgi:phosphoribosylamine--glycine ligase